MINEGQISALKVKAPAAVPDGIEKRSLEASLPTFDVQKLSVWFGAHKVLTEVSMQIQPRAVTAIIGPSGCGKSTFLRSLNRMHDLVPSARVEGQVMLFGEDLYNSQIDPTMVRR